jgi:DNA-binding beta-propeller fold protein YncE
VQSVGLSGGSVAQIASGQSYPEGIATDGVNVYWTTTGMMVGAPIAGGSQFVLASGQNNPAAGGLPIDVGIATDGTYVYWANYGGGSVNAVPVGGGATVSLARGTRPLGIAIDDTAVYFTDYGAGSVVKTPKCVSWPLPQ